MKHTAVGYYFDPGYSRSAVAVVFHSFSNCWIRFPSAPLANVDKEICYFNEVISNVSSCPCQNK